MLSLSLFRVGPLLAFDKLALLLPLACNIIVCIEPFIRPLRVRLLLLACVLLQTLMQFFVILELRVLGNLVDHELAHLFLSLCQLGVFLLYKPLGLDRTFLVFFAQPLKLLLLGPHPLGLLRQQISAAFALSLHELLVTRRLKRDLVGLVQRFLLAQLSLL